MAQSPLVQAPVEREGPVNAPNLPDPRPCRGDAYHSHEVGAGLAPEFTCYGCRQSEENGGKCAGAQANYFMLCAVASLVNGGTDADT